MSMILAVALQVATSAVPPPVPPRFSVLAPVAEEPCVARPGTDIVVCGTPLARQRLPLPDERVPDGATPSNPYVTGAGALIAENTPCATVQRGCLVGFGPPLMPIAKAAVGAIKGAFARKPDKPGRVSISMDDATP